MPSRKIVIASRKSDLARIQSLRVGAALKKAHPELEIDYRFRESLGDIQQDNALYKMPEKGVFTEDFVADLRTGACDIVVHSWKDLPTADRADTEVAATLPRADIRDCLVLRRNLEDANELRVLSSSPRRAYNLEKFLGWALPQPLQKRSLRFIPVRGNVPTRLRKLHEGQGEALIVAKAALDRLLSSTEAEFQKTRLEVRKLLDQSRLMILPVEANPPAAAQGALALEIKKGREDLRALLAAIDHPPTRQEVEAERKILAGYGGGCHQKIGVSLQKRSFGTVLTLKGLSDAGEKLDRRELLESPRSSPRKRASDSFPLSPSEAQVFFDRAFLSVPQPPAKVFYVARSEAWPENWTLASDTILLVSGLQSWRKLAARGLWVTASSEGLGEEEGMNLWPLLGEETPEKFVKLSHLGGSAGPHSELLATYELQPRAKGPDLSRKKHFFWMSASAFTRAQELFPEALKKGTHACGPGHTAALLRQALPASTPLEIYLSFAEWRQSLLEESGP